MTSSQTKTKIALQYSSDFYAWTQEQSRLLREGKWELLDIPNLAEEIESLGRQERKELVNRLAVLLGHLLKWQYQPDKRSKSWKSTIDIQRLEIKESLEENPSLKPYLEELITKGYRRGLKLAEKETCLPAESFPTVCPYLNEQVLSDNFMPD